MSRLDHLWYIKSLRYHIWQSAMYEIQSVPKYVIYNFISLGNFTGPYTIVVSTDGDNTNMNMGFEISYILLPC